MQRFLKQISIFISAIMLVIASGGFSLYQHYCNCTDEVNGSIVVEAADCHNNGESQSCCTVEVEKKASCCQPETDQKNTHHKCKSSGNCCTSEVTFLKTDDFNFSLDQKRSFGFIVAFVNIVESEYLQKEQSFLKETTFATDLPPPDFGKKLLIALHQFKIASPLV